MTANDNGTKPKIERAEEEEQDFPCTVYTYTGKEIDLFTFKTEDFDIYDVAHALSQQCRYNGHTKKFYSVAEHSVLLAKYVLEAHKGQLLCGNLAKIMLLHDAQEAYVGDIVYNLKKCLYQFEVLEVFIQEKILNIYGLSEDFNILLGLINQYDSSICIDEMEALMHRVDPTIYERPDVAKLGIQIQNWTPEQAEQEYLNMAKLLLNETFLNA